VQAQLVLRGRLVRLRSTVETDIADCACRNVPSLKAWQFDGPWYNGNAGMMRSSDSLKKGESVAAAR
jgi:hypothetical protein